MDEGDDLLRTIRSYVHGRVPVAYEDLVTELVARTVVKIMTTPEFYLHLTYVQALQQENARLQTLLTRTTRPRPATKAAPRKAPQKRVPPKVAVKKAQPRSRTGQFRKGATGR